MLSRGADDQHGMRDQKDEEDRQQERDRFLDPAEIQHDQHDDAQNSKSIFTDRAKGERLQLRPSRPNSELPAAAIEVVMVSA